MLQGCDVAQHMVRIHCAHCDLCTEYIHYKLMYEPIMRVRGGGEGALGDYRFKKHMTCAYTRYRAGKDGQGAAETG